MNIKFLKFLVAFMGILIIIGIIILIIGIYDKLQSSKTKNNKMEIDTISIQKPSNMNFISHSINKKTIILNYESDKKIKIIIFDLSLGKKIKEIDVLK